MWEPSDDLSRGEIIKISVLGSQGFVQNYRTIQKPTAQTEQETSRAGTSLTRTEGDNVSCTLMGSSGVSGV